MEREDLDDIVTLDERYSRIYKNPSVRGTLAIFNRTAYGLREPISRFSYGYSYDIPNYIDREKMETLFSYKNKRTASGVEFLVSYLISEIRRRVVIYVCLPFNFNHHKNVLGIGITNNCDEENFDMRDLIKRFFRKSNGHKSCPGQFSRRVFYDSVNIMCLSDNQLEVRGIMGNGHKSIIRVEIKASSKTGTSTL